MNATRDIPASFEADRIISAFGPSGTRANTAGNLSPTQSRRASARSTSDARQLSQWSAGVSALPP